VIVVNPNNPDDESSDRERLRQHAEFGGLVPRWACWLLTKRVAEVTHRRRVLPDMPGTQRPGATVGEPSSTTNTPPREAPNHAAAATGSRPHDSSIGVVGIDHNHAVRSPIAPSTPYQQRPARAPRLRHPVGV